MKKVLTRIFLLLIVMSAFAVQAQEKQDFAPTRVIKGAVIDKNGNPLPGATVRATGGAEVATTDADGTYSIEVPFWLKSLTASYPGLRDQKLNTTDKTVTIFTLKPLYRTYGFVNLMFANVWQVNPTGGYNDKVQQLGIMGGAYRKWGGYAKVMMGFFATHNGQYIYSPHIELLPTFTGGVIKPINKNLNVMIGGGMGCNYNFDYGNNDKIHHKETLCLAFEGVAMYTLKKVNFTLGLTYVTRSSDKYYLNDQYHPYNNGNLSVCLGIGMNI